MQNWFSIETEAEFRRREYRAAADSDARAAVAQADRAKRRRARLPAIDLAQVKQFLRVWPGWGPDKPLHTCHCTACSVAAGD